MAHKFFTLNEANEMIIFVKNAIQQLQQIKREFSEKRLQLGELERREAETGHDSETDDLTFLLECRMDFLQMEAQMQVNLLTQKGVVLRSIEQGLVDFPGMKDGEAIFWCWKEGEVEITHFHGWNEGFSGRQLISDFMVDYNG